MLFRWCRLGRNLENRKSEDMTVHMRPYIKDGIELDQIAVQGIRVLGYHGVLETERDGGQVFFADVVAHVNSRTAASRDDVAYTVNYSDMADRTAEVLAGSPNQLIESVAEQVARALLEMEGIECVDVTIHKPHAPLHVEFKDVTVSIRRDLSDGSVWADKRIGSSAGESDDPLDTGANPVRDEMDVRPAQPVGAVIALGGNLGEVEPTFRAALAELHRITGIAVQYASPLVRTAPEGGVDQPDYLNAVVRVQTSLSPRELLAACQGVEVVHGRDRSVAGSARTLDLDLISYDGVVGHTHDLTLPHPRAHQRSFVVLPWSHMEPHAVLEPHGPVVDLARQAGLEGVRMVSTQWPQVPAPDALAGPSVSASVTPVSPPPVEPSLPAPAAQPAPLAQPVTPAQPVPPAPSVGQPVEQPADLNSGEPSPGSVDTGTQPGVPRRTSFGVMRQTETPSWPLPPTDATSPESQ